MELDAWDQSRVRRKRKRYPIYSAVRREGSSLTLDEVIAKAHELYPDRIVTLAAARKWVGRDMLPSPTIQSFGRGKGTQAHYPVDTAPQMAVAAYLMDERYTQKEIAQARAFVIGDATIDTLDTQQVCDLITMALKPEVVSKEARRIFECAAAYARAIALARAGKDITSLWGGITFQAHGHDEQGRPTLHYSVSLPGLYWDPRLTGGDPEKEA